MGMFDYIKCEMLLPDPQPPEGLNGRWQTKDTPDQYMTLYTIRADGTLWFRPYELVTVPLAERPYPNEPEGSILRWVGSMGREEREPVQLSDFHGDVYFYEGTNEHGFWEYRARFTDGVAKITLVSYDPPPPEPSE